MKIFLGISGASGTIYGGRLLRALTDSGHDVTLCVSDGAVEVIRSEEGLAGPAGTATREEAMKGFLERHGVELGADRIWAPDDMSVPYSSGSALAGAAVVSPCSMSTLASIASGITRNLIHRVADVMLKEGRPLVLVPRETPLSEIHLRNMMTLKQAGAAIVPAMPGFYHDPATVEDLADFMAGKVLDVLGIDHRLFDRWGGEA